MTTQTAPKPHEQHHWLPVAPRNRIGALATIFATAGIVVGVITAVFLH